MAEIRKMPKPTMGGIMEVIGNVAKTGAFGLAAFAAPSPITIGIFAKQIWDDYQALKKAGAWYQANKKK